MILPSPTPSALRPPLRRRLATVSSSRSTKSAPLARVSRRTSFSFFLLLSVVDSCSFPLPLFRGFVLKRPIVHSSPSPMDGESWSRIVPERQRIPSLPISSSPSVSARLRQVHPPEVRESPSEWPTLSTAFLHIYLISSYLPIRPLSPFSPSTNKHMADGSLLTGITCFSESRKNSEKMPCMLGRADCRLEPRRLRA